MIFVFIFLQVVSVRITGANSNELCCLKERLEGREDMLRELYLSLSLVLVFACGLLYQLTLRSQCFFACLPLFTSPQGLEGLPMSGRSIVFIETSERMEPPPLVSCAVESAAKIYPEQPVIFFMKGLSNSTQLTSNTSYPAFSLLSAINNVFFVPLDMKRLFKDTPLFPWYTKVSIKIIEKVCVGREKQNIMRPIHSL